MIRIYSRISNLLTIAVIAFSLSSVFAGTLVIHPTKVSALRSTAEAPLSQGLMKFDISSIPDSSRIDLAELKISYSSDSTGTDTTQTILVGMCIEQWAADVSTVGSIRAPETLLVETIGPIGANRSVELNVTDFVTLWYTGKITNEGLIVESPSGQPRGFELRRGNPATLTVYFSHDNRPPRAK